jgi:hypothetical protein
MSEELYGLSDLGIDSDPNYPVQRVWLDTCRHCDAQVIAWSRGESIGTGGIRMGPCGRGLDRNVCSVGDYYPIEPESYGWTREQADAADGAAETLTLHHPVTKQDVHVDTRTGRVVRAADADI